MLLGKLDFDLVIVIRCYDIVWDVDDLGCLCLGGWFW